MFNNNPFRISRAPARVLAFAVLSTSAVALASPTTPAPGAKEKLGLVISPPWAGGKSHRIMNGYGIGAHKNTNLTDRANDHHALDFDLARSEAVHPLASGTVRFAGAATQGWSAYGTIVYIDHGNGYSSMYAHLESTAVQKGDTVTPATRIGAAGNSGTAAVHLHVVLYHGATFQENSFGVGPYGGFAVVPEVIGSCTKNGGVCEQLRDGDALTNTLSPTPPGPGPGPGPGTCTYGSVQARVHRDDTKPWAQTMALIAGKSFQVGAFHDGSGQLTQSGTSIEVTGPGGFKATPANLGRITAPVAGTYSVRVTCGSLSETATVTVKPGVTCPYQSVQARVHRDVTQPWAQQIPLKLGRSFEVGAFHDGSGQLADAPAKIRVTGPNGFTASPVNLAKITPPALGTYNVRVTCGDLTETATVTVTAPK